MDNTPSYDPEKPLWSIMTKSHGGKVSVIRDLTLDQARKTYERLDPWYGRHSESFSVHKDFRKDGSFATSSGSGSFRHVSDGDIDVREVFGPPGWSGFGEIEYWPKCHVIYTDSEGNILPDEYQEKPELAASHRRMREMERAAGEADVKASSENAPPAEKQKRRGWTWF